VIQYLLDNGADVDSRNIKQETPLHMAAFKGHAEESQLLLRNGATVDARSDSGDTPLHSAATNGCLCERLTKIFLAAGADVNARSHRGQTPLHDAARAGESKEVVHVLLRSGTKVDARTESGMTPLHEAARCTKPIQCIVRELLKAGAEVDSLDNNGRSPLDWALRYGEFRNVGVLVEHGAKVSAAAKLPLFQGAVASCDAQLVKVLLERGFRSLVNTPDSDGSTPLHLAIIARWVWLNGAEDNDGWSRTSKDRLAYEKEQQVSVALLLLNNGADIEALDAQGATALHHAIGFGTEQVISVLLEYGADVAVKAGDGKTALQMAKAIGNDASVRMLIQHGARDEVGVQDQPRERPARRKLRFFAGK
jgi:ankyrin repeat protein